MINVLVTKLAEAKASEIELETEHAAVLLAIKQAKRLVNDLDQQIRDQAMQSFEETGDMQPHPAVTIRTRSLESYQTERNIYAAAEEAPQVLVLKSDALTNSELLEWLLAHHPELLQIDERAIKALVKSGEGAWVEAIETRQPYVEVRTKLDEYRER